MSIDKLKSISFSETCKHIVLCKSNGREIEFDAVEAVPLERNRAMFIREVVTRGKGRIRVPYLADITGVDIGRLS